MSDPFKKVKKPVQQWLNQFADRVDYSRFRRGLTLFEQNRVESFQLFPNHFESTVHGRQDHYEVTGMYKWGGELPILDEYSVSCTCPDDAAICKHAVCVTIHLMLYHTENPHTPVVEDPNEQTRAKMVELPLQKLIEKLQCAPYSISSLREAEWTSLLDNRSTNKEIHETIVDLLDKFH
ncbi:SWIM zinc finger family protein [Pseudalkalibacillus decolorationis]|uniref:SWIM zinc finger family protein n=1 Tax=Pseudalkalibacillus decolorationis TaxID=163879 RepID=UPI00214941C7|nr:hypothetical protein [Pseudalkalibacillus decolorationis]